MKYNIGQNLVLLEYKNTPAEQPLAKPIGSAKILAYSEDTKLYRIKYSLQGSTKEDTTEVPEQRLYSLSNQILGR